MIKALRTAWQPNVRNTKHAVIDESRHCMFHKYPLTDQLSLT